MRKILLQSLLVLVFLGIVASLFFVIPWTLNFFETTSFRFVILFLVLIVASNILSKIAVKFLTL